MRTCKIGSTDDRAEIMWILNIVQKDQERIFPFLFCKLQHIFHLRILVSRCLCNDPLMSSGL